MPVPLLLGLKNFQGHFYDLSNMYMTTSIITSMLQKKKKISSSLLKNCFWVNDGMNLPINSGSPIDFIISCSMQMKYELVPNFLLILGFVE